MVRIRCSHRHGLGSIPSQENVFGFPGGTVVKNLPASIGDAGDTSLIPGSGRFPGEGNGNPLQYSCLENSMDRGAWQLVCEVSKELDKTEQLNNIAN